MYYFIIILLFKVVLLLVPAFLGLAYFIIAV